MTMPATHVPALAVPFAVFHSADNATILERLEGSPLIAAGKINVLALDGIRERLGPRWPSRAEQVDDHVTRNLSRHLGATGHFFRISETHYVVVQPTLERYAAQASCLTFMRELLTYFLGKAAAHDLDVNEVTELSAQGLTMRRLDPAAICEADAQAAQTGGPSADRPRTLAGLSEEPPEASPDKWSPFVARDGRELRVTSSLAPTFKLDGAIRIGYRIERRVIDTRTDEVMTEEQQARLPTVDIERIDMATIARGLSRLRSERQEAQPPMLMLPTTFTTISTRRGRAALVGCFREASDGVASRLVCEVSNLEGVPVNALNSACSMIKPFCYAVFGRAPDAQPRSVGALRGGGLNGIALSYQGPTEAALMYAELEPLVALCRTVSRTVMVVGLKRPEELVAARLAGASHATMRVAVR